MNNNKMTPKFPVLSLDSNGCVNLSSVLASFTAAINEEQAWALVYQSLSCARNVLGNPVTRDLCSVATSPCQIKIHQDGCVHEESFLRSSSSSSISHELQTSRGFGNKGASEFKIISSIGQIIFQSLDYGIPEDSERELSSELNHLLDTMTSVDDSGERPETDDEGIERDSGDSDDERMDSNTTLKLDGFLQMCRERLGNGTGDADAHYKAVCRALVTEALELSHFLEKVSQGTHKPMRFNAESIRNTDRDFSFADSQNQESHCELTQLHFTIWAKLWVQVITQLRNGFKLKKVQCLSNKMPQIEYELTPYEILMDDIRSRRYKLKQVMTDGQIPRSMQKDAHDIILEFIRSRPPLKKASERKLRPPPAKTYDPIETLMMSIRQEHKLRPTVTSVKSSFQRGGSIK